MSESKFYITTTLPYVNAEPHIGFALEIIEADVIARFHRQLGEDVIFNTGTDEHGQKIYQNARDAGLETQRYVDEFAATFADLKTLLNLSYTNFIRTTDPTHISAAQEFWKRCLSKGDIYKKEYKVKYCVGCELEKTDSELVASRCPLHPNRDLELIEEENYFFKFSQYQQSLLDYYAAHPTFIKPASKMKEITSFVEQGLQDFSVSRLKTKMPWGIAVPNDNEHVMYVWFDALVNYISTIGWPDSPTFNSYWPGTQLAGKDNLRQQSAMWQAMLFSAGVANSKQILINGFISVAGQKMSKSLGNVINPKVLVARYGVDATRYLLINLGAFGDDMDVTHERFDTAYTSELSNGLGNLCSRVAKLCEQDGLGGHTTQTEIHSDFKAQLLDYNLTQGLNWIKDLITQLDKYLTETTPWKKTGNERQEILNRSILEILNIAFHLQPYMPDVSQHILSHFRAPKIIVLYPLFPRLTPAH